jgi:hypothetical protein
MVCGFDRLADHQRDLVHSHFCRVLVAGDANPADQTLRVGQRVKVGRLCEATSTPSMNSRSVPAWRLTSNVRGAHRSSPRRR